MMISRSPWPSRSSSRYFVIRPIAVSPFLGLLTKQAMRDFSSGKRWQASRMTCLAKRRLGTAMQVFLPLGDAVTGGGRGVERLAAAAKRAIRVDNVHVVAFLKYPIKIAVLKSSVPLLHPLPQGRDSLRGVVGMCFRNTGRKTRRSIYTTSMDVDTMKKQQSSLDLIARSPPVPALPVSPDARRRGASGSAASARRAKPQRVVGQTCDCAQRKGFASANPVACAGSTTALTIYNEEAAGPYPFHRLRSIPVRRIRGAGELAGAQRARGEPSLSVWSAKHAIARSAKGLRQQTRSHVQARPPLSQSHHRRRSDHHWH